MFRCRSAKRLFYRYCPYTQYVTLPRISCLYCIQSNRENEQLLVLGFTILSNVLNYPENPEVLAFAETLGMYYFQGSSYYCRHTVVLS